MIDFSAILSSLKLTEWAFQKIRGAFTARQKQEIVKHAERLIELASMDDIQRYDTPNRKGVRMSAGVADILKGPAPRAGDYLKKGAPAKRKATKKRTASKAVTKKRPRSS